MLHSQFRYKISSLFLSKQFSNKKSETKKSCDLKCLLLHPFWFSAADLGKEKFAVSTQKLKFLTQKKKFLFESKMLNFLYQYACDKFSRNEPSKKICHVKLSTHYLLINVFI